MTFVSLRCVRVWCLWLTAVLPPLSAHGKLTTACGKGKKMTVTLHKQPPRRCHFHHRMHTQRELKHTYGNVLGRGDALGRKVGLLACYFPAVICFVISWNLTIIFFASLPSKNSNQTPPPPPPNQCVFFLAKFRYFLTKKWGKSCNFLFF